MKVLPFVFVAGTEGVPNYNERIEALEDQFKLALLNASPISKTITAMTKMRRVRQI